MAVCGEAGRGFAVVLGVWRLPPSLTSRELAELIARSRRVVCDGSLTARTRDRLETRRFMSTEAVRGIGRAMLSDNRSTL